MHRLGHLMLAAGTVTVVGMLASFSVAAPDWNVASGDWFTATNWDPTTVPGSGDEVNIRNGGTADYDATGQPGDSSTVSYVHVATSINHGDGFLNINGGTLIATDFDRDAIKVGTAPGMTGAIVQTGGTVHAMNGGFRIGAGRGGMGNSGTAEVTLGESGTYTISGGSMISGGPGDLGRIVVGENDGNGTLNIIGTGPTEIKAATRFEVESNGKLNFTLDPNGVTPIVAGEVGSDDHPRFRDSDEGASGTTDPGAMLNVDFSALTTIIGDILLIENLTSDPLLDPNADPNSNGNQFLNAFDGDTLHTFGDGSSYQISYEYEAGTDSLLNDLALIAIAAPAVPGDFNGDNIVNGYDFLAWQRGESPNPFSPADLALWEANYDNFPLGGAIQGVPEPSSLTLLTALLASSTLSRCGKRR